MPLRSSTVICVEIVVITWCSRASASLPTNIAALGIDEPQRVAGIPRNQTLIIQGATAQNADWFNLWAAGGGSATNGLQQLTSDTLWFINPEGENNFDRQNALAWNRRSITTISQMTVKLRQGIYWSDGVEFTSADLAYTVQTQIDHPGMNWSAAFSINVAGIEVPGNPATPWCSVSRRLESGGSDPVHGALERGLDHAQARVQKAGDPLKFANNPPVSLSAYVLNSYDKLGNWTIWKLRDDWKRTSIGMDWGEPSVKYVVYRNAGNPEARVIEQHNHNLDVINDMAPEGMFTMMRTSKSVASWFKDFPFAHPDPTLPAVLLNNKVAPFDNKDVRWALALMIDIRAARSAPIAAPPICRRLRCRRPARLRKTISCRCRIG